MRIDGDERLILDVHIWKSGLCEYHGVTAKAGPQYLGVRFGREIGDRSGGELRIRRMGIERPTPGGRHRD